VADIERTDVRGLGSQLRRNKAFGPAGTNVDFVMPRGRALLVRTFERGVEDETLACGTGIAAAAVAMALSGKAASPVTLLSRGGDRFRVSFEAAGRGARRLRLEGPARMVFEGEIEC
jgi:diaminopimelate epimerase